MTYDIPRSGGVFHYIDRNHCNGINIDEGHTFNDVCYESPVEDETSDAAEPLDDLDGGYDLADEAFDSGFENYLENEKAQRDFDDADMLANADYDLGYRDGSRVGSDVYTIYAPRGASFTLTVTG